MNEWEFQTDLTNGWAAHGLNINGVQHVLLAWEIMLPSWRINDASKYWSEPSLDFLVADEQMRLTVIELKTKVTGIKLAWQALCQVTHRAAELSRTLTAENLDKAFLASWSGEHGRIKTPSRCRSFSEHHRGFFGALEFHCETTPKIRRCIAAHEFGKSWPGILAEFNALSEDALRVRVRDELTSKTASRELKRFENLPSDYSSRVDGPVFTLLIT